MNVNPTLVKILHHGADRLSDAELVSIFLTARDGETALAKATDILEKCGGLAQLLKRCPYTGITSTLLTPSQRARMTAGMALAERAAQQTIMQGDVLSSPEHVRRYLSLYFQGKMDEIFAILFLDNRHRVVSFQTISIGTVDSAAVFPRTCLRLALQLNAAACISVHQHPSGVAEPSDTDVRLVRKLTDAFALIDVRHLDSLIYGQGVCTSLAERGLM